MLIIIIEQITKRIEVVAVVSNQKTTRMDKVKVRVPLRLKRILKRKPRVEDRPRGELNL
jgi:hypothetical protein